MCENEKEQMDCVCKDLVENVGNFMRRYTHQYLAQSYAIDEKTASREELQKYKLDIQQIAQNSLKEMEEWMDKYLWKE